MSSVLDLKITNGEDDKVDQLISATINDNIHKQKFVNQEASILSLPVEILEIILENEDLSIEDIVSFGTSCRQLYNVVFLNNKLWKIKVKRWKREKMIRKYMKQLKKIIKKELNKCDVSDSEDEQSSLYEYGSCNDSLNTNDNDSELSDCFLE